MTSKTVGKIKYQLASNSLFYIYLIYMENLEPALLGN